MKYWAYINNEIKGPFETEELIKVDGFSPSTLVCPQSSVEEETKDWKEARELPEIAVLITKDLTTENGIRTETKELNSPQNKEEIIIERFGIENIFTPVTEVESNVQSTTDPLTLSQIRKKTEAQAQAQNSEKEVEKQDVSPNEPQLQEIKINEIEIPSTDELLKSVENTVQEMPSTNISEFPEFLKENIQPTNNPEITQNLKSEKEHDDIKSSESTIYQDDKSKVDISKIKEEIFSDIQKMIDEKISLSEEKMKAFLSSTKDSNIDIQGLKSELTSIIDSKISSLSFQQPQILQDESLKKEIEDLKTLTSHFEIEIKDLRTRMETLENKTKTEPVQLSRERIQSQSSVFSQSTTVTIGESNKNKSSSRSKLVLLIILIPLTLFAILFMLRQFGIFDFMSLISANKHQPTQVAAVEQQQSTQQETYAVTQDTSNVIVQEQSTTTLKEETQQQLPPPSKFEEVPVESILNEVKDYKINSPYNLEKTISIILKSKKADLSSVKWDAVLTDNGKYVITVTARGAKPIEFKFEFEQKTKLLQPLNTLSVNTLKMMMGTTSQTGKKEHQNNKQITSKKIANNKKVQSKNNVLKKTKTQITQKLEEKQIDQEDGQVLTDDQSNKQTLQDDNQETSTTEADGEYLIIGE